MAQLTITMPDELAEKVSDEAETNMYLDSKSEVIRQALRHHYGWENDGDS